MSSKRQRRKKEGSEHAGPPHIDEKWLVSYSDMMTLLFGLFVMLYSIALEKVGGQKEFNKVLKEISTKGFQGIKTINQEKSETQSIYQTEIDKLKKSLDETATEKTLLAQEKTKLEEELALAKANEKELLEKQNTVLAKTDEPVKKDDLLGLRKTLSENKAKLEQLEKQKSDLEKYLAATLAEKEDLLKRTPASAPPSKNKTVLLLAKWTDEKYDIDLELTDSSSKRVYNFKKRHYEGDATTFILDAAKGPATELIRIEPNSGGQYTARVKVYNNRGATNPANIDLVMIGPDGEQKLESIALDGSGAREKMIPLSFGSDGQFRLPASGK